MKCRHGNDALDCDEPHPVYRDEDGVLRAGGRADAPQKMKRKDFINLLNRAAAALETPCDLSKEEVAHVIEDLTTVAQKIEAKELDLHFGD